MGGAIQNRGRELRTARGWTQEQLAGAVGVSRQSINSIERNRYVPSLELALTFALIFACPTDEIFQLESHSWPPPSSAESPSSANSSTSAFSITAAALPPLPA